jgi:hypothetical protein
MLIQKIKTAQSAHARESVAECDVGVHEHDDRSAAAHGDVLDLKPKE